MKTDGRSIKFGAGLVALVALAVWGGVLPANRAADRLESQIRDARVSALRAETRAQDVRTLADTLTTARVFAASNTKASADPDVSSLMHDIGDLLSEMSVSTHEMKQDRAVERDGVRVTPVNLVMHATYPSLVRLLDHIERGDRLVRIARVQAGLPRGAEPGSGMLLIEVDLESIAPIGATREAFVAASQEGPNP